MDSRIASANSVEKTASDITQDITTKNTAGVYSRKNRRGRVRHSLFTCAAALVVFVTVYALILPALMLTGLAGVGLSMKKR